MSTWGDPLETSGFSPGIFAFPGPVLPSPAAQVSLTPAPSFNSGVYSAPRTLLWAKGGQAGVTCSFPVFYGSQSFVV